MPTEVEKLRKINLALMDRVERSVDQQGNAFSLFQTAIALEKQVRQRTDELASTLRRLEQSNRALSRAKEAAEAANRSKTRFLAAASHDVLQPLNAANLSVSTLADIQTTELGRSLARQIEQSLATMDELLRTLLDISKLDSGVMQPTVATVSLKQLFQSLRSDFMPIAAERGLEIRFRATDAWCVSDRTMLRRILQNIVSNGLRYTRRGGVVVGVRRRGEKLRIDVADTGIGIRNDQFEAIFEEFYRGAPAGAVDFGRSSGLGLGLSIVKRMVSALGHELAFRTVEGRGSVFQLTVPLAGGPGITGDRYDEPFGSLARGTLAGAAVLLIENDRAVMRAMTNLLESWRCHVRMASHMEEAVEIVTDGNWCPDIILADEHLDGPDLGSDTIERVRTHLGVPVPAIIVTADPGAALAEKAHGLGAELMRKPLKPAELRALMAHLLTARRTIGEPL